MNTTTAPAAVSASAPAATDTPGGLRRAGLVARLARDRVALTSAIVLGLIVLAAMFAPWVAPYDPYYTDLSKSMQPPSAEHWFGTDNTGRDMLSRVLFGARSTLVMGLAGVLLGGGLGALRGILAAFYKRIDPWIMRLVDILLAFPAIMIGLAIFAIVLTANLLGDAVRDVLDPRLQQ